MFDHAFSFDLPSSPSIRSSSSTTRESSRAVSPCSTSAPLPPPRLSVTDLVAQFADQRLRKESAICYDSCEAYANRSEDADWSVPPHDEVDFNRSSRARRPHSPSTRTQRQMNTRLLCSASHHRDIATLVARMVNDNDQCSITPLSSTTSAQVDNDDEGYNTASDIDMTLSASRRSSVATAVSRVDSRCGSELRSKGACVSKTVRRRRDRVPRRMNSSEQTS